MRPPLRVALLAWSYDAVPTGLTRAAASVTHGLAEAGARVSVFAADQPAGAVSCDGDVEVVGCAPDRTAFSRWARRRAAVGHLVAPAAFRRAVLERGPFDVVEATNWYAPATLVLNEAGPLVIRHSTPALWSAPPSLGPRDRFDLAAAHRLEVRAARAARGALFNTVPSELAIRPLYGLPDTMASRVVPLALPSATIGLGQGAPIPPPGPLRLLFVGRAEARKGFAAVVGALAELVKTLPDPWSPPTLALIGTEPDDAQREIVVQGLPPATASRIVHHGRVDDDALREAFRWAHLVLAPSVSESYGLVYREAAAFGRTLVASSRDPSARAFLAEVPCGVLADDTAPSAVAGAVRRAIELDRDAVARAGRAHAATLTTASLGEGTLAAYRRITQLASGPPRRHNGGGVLVAQQDRASDS